MSNRLPLALSLLLALFAAGCSPSDPVTTAREKLANNRPHEALEVLREVPEARAEDPEVHYLYGIAMARSGQPTLGQWSLRKAMADPEWLVPAGLEVIRTAILTDSHDAAVETANRILEAEPDHMEALLLRARAHVDSRRGYEQALADADLALELDPDETEALILRVVALLGLERVEDAEPGIDDLARRFAELDLGLQQEAHYCTTRAAFSVAKGELEEAEERFEQCLALAPGHRTVVAAALEFFDAEENSERSLEILRTALEENPDSAGYRRGYAARLHQTGDADAARELLMEGTLLTSPVSAIQAWVDLGDLYLANEDYAAAVSAIDRAVARQRELGVDPDPQLLFQQAEMLVMAERFEEALERANETPVPVYRNLVEGRVFLEQGRSVEALQRFGDGLLLWPENAVARYYAAIAAERVGDIDRAVEEYRYSIRAGAAETDARVRLARLHAAEGDPVRGEQAWMAGRGPIEFEAQLEGIRLAAQWGRPESIRRRTARFRDTDAWGRVVAVVAEGMGDRRGPEAAAQMVLGTPELDLTRPENGEALRVLVEALVEMGTADEASPTIDAGILANPEVALFPALRGRVLESEETTPDAVRAAYQAALALDGEQGIALEGLARLAVRGGDPDQALDFYARAAAADDEVVSPVRAGAELLLSLERATAAEAQLEELLVRDPYGAWAALELAKLRVARGADLSPTRVLVQRAIRFQGGEEAEVLLSQLSASDASTRVSEASPGDAALP